MSESKVETKVAEFHARVLVGVYTAAIGLLLLPWGVLTVAVVALDEVRGALRAFETFCISEITRQHQLLAKGGHDGSCNRTSRP